MNPGLCMEVADFSSKTRPSADPSPENLSARDQEKPLTGATAPSLFPYSFILSHAEDAKMFAPRR